MGNDILVLVEHHEGAIKDGALELLAKARELAGATGGEVVALLLGTEAARSGAALAGRPRAARRSSVARALPRRSRTSAVLEP